MQLKQFKLAPIYYNLIRFASPMPGCTYSNQYKLLYQHKSSNKKKKEEETILWNKIQLINLFMCFLLFSFTQSLKGIFSGKALIEIMVGMFV